MTSITRNLPWFIRDLGIAVVGEECYSSLIENLDLKDVVCIKYSISKGLGIGIVVGGSVMKVPQVLLILNAQSARGLSLTGYILETLSYAITLAYSYRNDFPFSTYGENLFLTMQNVLITFLIIAYSQRPGNKSGKLITAVAGLGSSFFALTAISKKTLAYLQVATLPLSLFSKLPQISQNYRAKSTGQLSVVAIVAQIAGCLARLFTTSTEVGDPIVTAGFAFALVLNLILGAQLWMYWGQAETIKSIKKEKIKSSPPRSPSPAQRVATPPPVGNRKWARKVD